ncbi:MAG: nucleotidyltransferase substrate binding protein [Elusimicrobiales bacterium]|nr:nucleotidyltransferase substrate binding protein [Elusimicrobiales bacterium]
MKLDLSSLKKAVGSLGQALETASSTGFMKKLTRVQRDLVKAGVIQNFEFTYELCWKFTQRWLSANANREDAQSPLTRKDLFRMAAQHGLIKKPENWFAYSEARNITAHTYDTKKAARVYAQAAPLLADAKYLLAQLQKTAND